MNNTTIRRLYIIGLFASLVLFALMVWDHYGNDNDWLTPLTITFAVIVLWLIVMLFLNATGVIGGSEVTFTPVATGRRVDYVGDVHEVVDLEGIGPTYAEKLNGIGVQNTQQLLFTSDAKLAKATGAPAKTIQNWKAMSQLVKVRGVGPQYAEAMVRAGVSGIEELIDEPAAAIAGGVQGYLDSLGSKVIGQKVSTKRVQGWQSAARKLEKAEIDLTDLKVMPLESKAAKAGAASS